MKAQCPNCEAVYRIDESKIPEKGAYAKCRKCQMRFLIRRESDLQLDTTPRHNMTCPKCGHEQPPSDRCTQCRIVFSKYDAAQQKRKEEVEEADEAFDAFKRPDSPPAKPSIGQLYLSFRGRVSLKTYWLYLILPWIGIYLVVAFIEAQAQSSGRLLLVFWLLVLWPGLAMSVKRWHDRDKSGLWVLFNLVPVIGPIWSFIQTCALSGTAGINRFGPEPI